MMNQNLLSIRDASKTYRSKGAKVEAVKELSLDLKPGAVLGIIGESGSGKSTLAKMIIGLEEINGGEVLFRDEHIRTWLKKKPKEFRRRCQMIFQNPFESFDPLQTIGQSLLEVVKIHHRDWSRDRREAYCRRQLEQYGLTPAEDFLRRYPQELSGGQLQRIAVLRAMIPEPELLLADEAVSMLDVSVRADIINLFYDIAKTNKTSLIFISHDILTSAYLCDDLCVMYRGRVVEYGKAEKVIRSPVHPYTQALVACCGDRQGSICTDFLSGTEQHEAPGGCPYLGRCPRAAETCRKNLPGLTAREADHYVRCFHCK
jgi:peptide/nickel transport system ATP-binding protein